MKKFFSVLTAAICLTACAFSFTACGDKGGDGEKQHVHDYATQWTTNATHHWHECKNDGCDQKEKDKAAHYDNDNNGKCDECDYTMGTPSVPVSSVELNETAISLEVGGTATLTATLTPENATDKLVTWESDKTNIATVDNTGKITAIKDGTAVITVKTANGKSASCTVTVTPKNVPVTGVELNKSSLTLEIDDEETLTATLTPENATDKTVTWTVAPAGIVSVENGVVTAIKDGTAVITATTANNKTATCSVTVNAPLTNAQVVAALDTYCKENAVKAGIPKNFTYDENNVVNGSWYLTKNADGNIVKAEYGFNYVTNDGNGYYVFTETTFTSPISVKNLADGKITDVSYSRVYRISYDANIQSSRQDLTNAICETAFETNGTLIARYIVDRGASSSDAVILGTTIRMFTVIEVTDKGVQEAKCHIKTSSSDAEYIARLENNNDYRVFDKVSYTIVGDKLNDNNELF